jgi:Leucine-rich repeat (LRR) protein
MKKLLLILLCLPFIGFGQQTYVPDDNFEQALINLGYDTVLDDSVITANINTVTSLTVSNEYITDLTGIEDFTALTALDCYYNQLTSLDISNNTALTTLRCYDNQITSLDLSQNTTLLYLYCDANQLTSLDLSQNTALTHLFCVDNQLTSLDLSQNTTLLYLYCDANQLTSLDVSQNSDLIELSCGDNQLTSLDVSQNTALTELDCSQNQLTSIDLSGASALTTLDCSQNQLTSIDLSGASALTTLYCYTNGITSLDLSNNLALTSLSCSYNSLTNLDLSNNLALTTLDCYTNGITSIDLSNTTALTSLQCGNNQITNLDVSNNLALTILDCRNNQLTSLDVSNNTALSTFYCFGNQLTILDVSNNTALSTFYCHINQLTSIDLSNHSLIGLSIITTNNQNLFCIDVDNPALAQVLSTGGIDPWTSFDTNCVTALGCTDSTACNYIPNATLDDGSCLISYGCTDSLACNYNSTAQCDDGSCLIVYGCTDSLACNYNSTAQCDDGSCLIVYGCTDSLACNYNSTAQCDDGLCLTLYGCTDTLACNYDSNAQCDDGGCTYLSVTLNNNQLICSNFSNATLTVNYNTGSYTYLWSNGETTQSIDSLAMGSYSVIVTDTAGCSTTLSANVTLATSPAINMFPEICYITVDSATGNNKVIIKPMANLLTSKFIIYKESSANIYSPIDTINSNILEHLDISSNPMAQSYRYKISVLDTCSNESVKSDFHKTIHLTMSLGLNGEVNLLWNNYEGYQPSDYLIFRSVNNGAMNQVGILPGTNLAFTDLTPPSGILNYQVRAIAPNCNIIPFAKNATNMLFSNVINHSTTAVNELVNSKKVIKITDLLGRETKGTKNEVLFYIYDDGTVEKRIVIE